MNRAQHIMELVEQRRDEIVDFTRELVRPPSETPSGNEVAVVELLERKIYNEHDFVENLKIALAFPGRIEPGKVMPQRKRDVKKKRER